MVKTTIKEITEKFDKNGTLIERLTREEFIEDDESCGLGIITNTTPSITSPPYTPYAPITPINTSVDSAITPWCPEPYSSISTSDNSNNSTENAFKQAVSKCINTK